MVGLLAILACAGWTERPPGADPAATSNRVDTVADAGESGSLDSGEDTAGPADSAEDTAPPTPRDADGDGHVAVEDGGDDCDDSNAYVYPGATEYCDTVDQDCDGDALAPGACALEVPVPAGGTRVISDPGIGGTGMIYPDLTGDGVDDYLYFQYPHGEGNPDMFLFARGALPDEPWDLSEAWTLFRGESADFPPPMPAGDMDGDGWADVALVGYFFAPAVHFGPFDGPGSSRGQGSDADVIQDGYPQNGDPWFAALLGVDIDGDGRDDVIMADPSMGGSSSTERTDIYYQVYFGGGWGSGDGCQVTSALGNGRGSLHVVDAGDGDGDGVHEIGLRVDGDARWFVAGSDSRRLCDSYLEDIASGRYTGVSLTGRDSTPLGDLDGDGYDDFGASLSAGVDVGEPAAYFFSASDVLRGEFTEDDAAGSVLAESGSEWGGIRAVSQGPGGVPGVLVDGAGLPGRTFIPLDHVPAPYEELPTKRLSMNLRDNYATFGDLDADGFADFPSSFDDDDAGVNDSYVLPGFDLDWDDDSLW